MDGYMQNHFYNRDIYLLLENIFLKEKKNFL